MHWKVHESKFQSVLEQNMTDKLGDGYVASISLIIWFYVHIGKHCISLFKCTPSLSVNQKEC